MTAVVLCFASLAIGLDARPAFTQETQARSSFRGIQLDMTEAQIEQSLDRSFSLGTQPPGPMPAEGSMNYQWRIQNDKTREYLYIAKGEQLCGKVTMSGGVAALLQLEGCYFDIGAWQMSIQDFARQLVESYGLEEGMEGRSEIRGEGSYQHEYVEYTGVRAATSERFTASYSQLSGSISLTVQPVSRATFN
ncbi:hypothetical protein [Mesorhizobium vachelliae]|uniref:hypothetical protein n=1 Tax=Mesorhizobium vachelliae TaxID=3072309 RepID=UPI002A23C586|nr:hypothetical protein [Mesorhizobium sp. VK25D]